ncbi:prion protein b [Synchiropus splendidus]|uniref:prion protein b n=1 Tax=Synchiropus splendidus TaxID=270530 RepID=UPI00237E16F3|nr:prion protein b [Synchiropus splendidus]
MSDEKTNPHIQPRRPNPRAAVVTSQFLSWREALCYKTNSSQRAPAQSITVRGEEANNTDARSGSSDLRTMMVRFCEAAVVGLLLLSFLNIETSLAKRSGSSTRRTSNTGSRGGTQSKPSSSSPGGTSNRNPNPYPAGGSYPHPGTGNTQPGGYPRQNPSYPSGGNTNPGGYPRQPAGNPGGYNPNQYPGRTQPGGYPNQNPAGGVPAPGGYPNQYPGRASYPAGGGNPAGGYPAGGGYSPGGSYPGRGGVNPGGFPNQYPAGGGYPVRGGNTGPGWGSPGGYPGGYPAANPGGYPGGYPGRGAGGQFNWNPNNQILSPRFGGGGYGYGGYGRGGSPFAQSVQNMGYKPKSTGFAKKALMAAGVGAVAGMAVGYGIGRFPRPHFSFRNPEEEYYYNNYMYRRYGSRSTDEKDFGRDYVYQPPPRAESYDKFMDRCMLRTDLLKDQDEQKDDDTVSIEEIGYPALIEQLKARKCVEEYMKYSESFLKQRSAQQQSMPSRSTPLSFGGIQLLSSILMLLSSTLLLQ